MSETISPLTHLKYGIEMVCKAWKFPRSSFYYSRNKALKCIKSNRGRCPKISDEELLKEIVEDINNSHFHGEGHRKIHARLRLYKRLEVGRNRVLKMMKNHKLLSPYRFEQGLGNLHQGRITTDSPNIMWGTDAAKIFTFEDGWNELDIGSGVIEIGHRHVVQKRLKKSGTWLLRESVASIADLRTLRVNGNWE